VGIFLVDEQGEWAVLRSATGEGGPALIEREYRQKVGEMSLVGFVTGTGQPRLALDVGVEAVHFSNPLLPATRSELILPLKSAGKIIGALDLQSTAEAAFDEEDVQIFQTLADQLAIAIENARLFQEMGQALNQLEMAQGRFTQEAWRVFNRRAGPLVGYQNKGLGLEPAGTLNPEARQALLENRPVVLAHPEGGVENNGRPRSALAVPIRLRGQVFGVLNVRFADQPVSQEMVSTFEEIAARLSLVLENTRLLYEAQRLAEREQQINLISTQVRSSVNVDSILQNTVRELGRVLGTSRAFIQIGIQQPVETGSQQVFEPESEPQAGESRAKEGLEE
jgi:GAF domain-containing protein